MMNFDIDNLSLSSSSVKSLPQEKTHSKITLSDILSDIHSFVMKREKYSQTFPTEVVIIYIQPKIIDITFTKYPDSETARLGVRDILSEFRDKSEEVWGIKQILEIRGQGYILAGSKSCDVLILFKSRPEWKATIIGNWLIELANLLSEESVIPSPYLLIHAIRYIIKSQNKLKPDSYNLTILKMIIRADKIYPVTQGSQMMIRSALRALSIKAGESLAELGERLLYEGYLSGDMNLSSIANSLQANLVNVIKVLIELEARGIIAI